MEAIRQLVDTITKGIEEKKGRGIVVADLSAVEGSICRFSVICEGSSPTQVDAIAESIEDTVRETTGEKPVHVVGRENAQWVAMDYTDVIVHVFLPDVREYYDLENLWSDAKLCRIEEVE